MPAPYEGVHGFVFLQDTDPMDPAEVIRVLLEDLDRERGPVFFASLFEGDFAGFAHFAADDIQELANYTGTRLFDAGVRSDFSTEGSVYVKGGSTMLGPKRQSPRFCGICRVPTSEKPRAVLAAIAKAFDESDPFVGASQVIGRFPLLVELGSDDEEELGEAIERLRGVSGVEDGMWVGTADTGDGTEQAPGA
jgi:hypothetical protein